MSEAHARELHRWQLSNGLRVVVVPQPGVEVACVAVSYAVGFRDEEVGQTGFAHLFEHLMTQGSRHLDKLEHKTLIEGSGGWYSGQTRHDYTGYMSTVPKGALALALWCEADRMSGLRLTRANLDNQVSVVKQEIRGNVLSQPYGGFPCFQVDPALFESFANNHDGYGDFTDLERITVDDAAAFFASYYGPGNAVLSVAGDVDPAEVRRLVDDYFGSVAAIANPSRPDLTEPRRTAEKWVAGSDRLATNPALAVGYVAPDPHRDRESYLRFHLLSTLLSNGAEARLARRLVTESGLASSVVAALGSVGDWQGTVAPAQYAIGVQLRPGVDHRAALAVLDSVIEDVDDLSDDEVAAVAAMLSAGYERAMDPSYNAALYTGLCELLHGDAALIDQPPRIWRSATAASLAAVGARVFDQSTRAVVALEPEGT